MEVARQSLEPFAFAPNKRPLDMVDADEPRTDRSEKANLRRLAIVNERRQYEETLKPDSSDTESASADQPAAKTPPAIEIDPDSGLHVPTLRATSVIPSLSLMYADTAPREVWRPQIEAWMKKSGHRIRDVERAVEASDKLDEKYVLVDPKPLTKPKPTPLTKTATVAVEEHLPPPAASITMPSPQIHSNAHVVSNHHHISEPPMLKPPQSPIQHIPPPPHMASPHPSPHMETSMVASPALTSPPKPIHSTYSTPSYGKRRCISCGSDQSPCWRPSWSASAGQLCNSCGLRYKKTGARCTESDCGRIPAKGEWAVMRNTAKRNPDTGRMDYACIYCRGVVEVNERF
ncbi:Transcriptional regulatory protein [Yarrowia sp. C11]|nr:Transcriptional regulatory protein [Yarrowia sp. C11]KAG5370494.1 Transcriptional regulatory protein [Yarrowia sp. E02]